MKKGDGIVEPIRDQKKALGVFSIGLMTAAAVVTSLRGLPLLAKEEMTMFAYLAFTVIFYLIPASLVSAMTVALYLIAYMFMYAAGIRLRYTKPDLARPFKVPVGLAGMWLVAGVGFVGVLFSFLVAFFPPDQLPVGSPILYVTLVIVGTVVFCGIPLILHEKRRPNWAEDVQSGE